MSESRLAIKVGLFVFLGLTALAVLLINFSKSSDWFKETYEITLRTTDVGGIRQRATVFMAGYPIGYVKQIDLAPDGRTVLMTISIYKEFQVRRNCLFTIEQSGFLGDQYVAITPVKDYGRYLEQGDIVRCEPPFNLQDTARRANDLLQQVGGAVTELKFSISNVNDVVFNQHTLTNIVTNILEALDNIRYASFSVRTNIPKTLTNIHDLSERAVGAVTDVQHLVREHTGSVARAIGNLQTASSNVVALSLTLKEAGADIGQLVDSNSVTVTATLKNIENASISVTNLLVGLKADLEAGKGMLGGLLKDEAMRAQTEEALRNIANLSSNLDLAAGNLNRYGLWWMLKKPKYSKTNETETAKTVEPPGSRWW